MGFTEQIQGFRDHVATCTRPSTAGDDNASSALTSPPSSPSQTSQLRSSSAGTGAGPSNLENVQDEVVTAGEARQLIQVIQPAPDVQEAEDKLELEKLDDPRPYINPKTDFEYYDYSEQTEQTEPQEASDADQNHQDATLNPPDTQNNDLDAFRQTWVKELTENASQKANALQAQDISEDQDAAQDQDASQDHRDAQNMEDAQDEDDAQDQDASQILEVDDMEDTAENPDVTETSEASHNPPIGSQKAPETTGTGKYPFPKVTEVAVFEKYLEDAENMPYEELYRRTAVVSNNLVALQTEWDAIDKEIYVYEKRQKAKQKIVEEETKAVLEKERLKEDAERDEVAETYSVELKLKGEQWQEFMAEHEDSIPEKIIRHLLNLRNPQFMAAARKKRQAAINRAKKLLNEPEPETRRTKEDEQHERRQKGRYIDVVKFDDMKHADVYGFEYSAHAKHYGEQPEELRARRVTSDPTVNSNSDPISNLTTNPNGDDANPIVTGEGSRSRTQRKVTRKVYEADASATPEDSEEEGQKKRVIKRPKIFTNGVETLERSRGQSRSGTPAVRTFASGKRVGRPPAKSKLQAVELAHDSAEPEGSEIMNDDGLNLDEEHQELAPSQEEQLHDAAESLVNQTQTDKASTVPAKRKHAGGRPRKIRAEVLEEALEIEVEEEEEPKPKRRHAGGRPRKNRLPSIPLDEEVEIAVEEEQKPISKPKPKKRRGRVRKEAIPEDDVIQVGEENVLQSTEQDDGSQYTTSRPTSSDSNTTASTFGSRRSARPATREKTATREARASVMRRGSNAVQPPHSLPTSTRSKRKRASPDSPIVVEPIQFDYPQPVGKKRRTRGKQELEDVIEALPEVTPAVSTNRPTKRKRGSTINEYITVAGPSESAPVNFAPPPKKARRRVKVKEEGPEVEADADIDEASLDPATREELRKQAIKQEKSRKLSENMKARWAKGGMKEAQETRKANNALKRAHKAQIQANQAAGLPPPPPPVLLGAQPRSGQASASAPAQGEAEPEAEVETPAETPVETPAEATPAPAPRAVVKRNRTKSRPTALPPMRPASTRARRPTRTAMGLDGADDEDEDEEDEDEDDDDLQFTSEYDQFQALSSPRKPVLLGKRVRKSLVDLSQYMDSEDEEEL